CGARVGTAPETGAFDGTRDPSPREWKPCSPSAASSQGREHMKFTRNRLAALAAALVLVIVGCAKQSEQTSETVTPTPAPTERMAYAGTMNGTSATIVFDPADNQ